MQKLLFSGLAVVVVLSGCMSSKKSDGGGAKLPAPPVAKQIPKVQTLHGERRVDEYFWLREKTNPAVATYLKAENAYTDAVMKPTKRLQQTLYKEMLSHLKETDVAVPYRKDGWFHYWRTEKGKQYRILCRKQ